MGRVKAKCIILEEHAHNHNYEVGKEYMVDGLKFDNKGFLQFVWVRDGNITFVVNAEKVELIISKGNRKIKKEYGRPNATA